jgi:polyhydroxyalkanoate synthesis repressor PhaR
MSEPDPPVLIKKYSNRRLYDTRQSKYITLEELAAVVKTGTRVQVVDAKTGSDLTRQVLTQVILEQQDRLEMIPTELLHGIIRVQGTLQQAPLTAWLQQMTQQFSTGGSQWAQQMGQWLTSFGFSPKPASAPSADPPPPANDSNRPKQSRTNELDELRRRMDALLNRLGGEPKG